MHVAGWTTWGRVDFNGEPLRIYKHYSGPLVALLESYPDPFILLSQMNEYLEAATIETAKKEPTDATN